MINRNDIKLGAKFHDEQGQPPRIIVTRIERREFLGRTTMWVCYRYAYERKDGTYLWRSTDDRISYVVRWWNKGWQ